MKAREARAWLEDLAKLAEVVELLRSVAAAELQRSERVLATARAYRTVAEEMVSLLAEPGPEPADRGHDAAVDLLIVYTSTLGMCGDFNDRMLAAADDLIAREHAAGRRLRLICVGAHAEDHFAGRQDVAVLRQLDAPTSVDGLPATLRELAAEIAARADDAADTVALQTASYRGPGAFDPVRVRLLPPELPPPSAEGRARAQGMWFYLDREPLLRQAVQELVFGLLYALLAETLAAEHGARVVATERARDGLERERLRILRTYRAARQREITDEIIEVSQAAASVMQADT